MKELLNEYVGDSRVYYKSQYDPIHALFVDHIGKPVEFVYDNGADGTLRGEGFLLDADDEHLTLRCGGVIMGLDTRRLIRISDFPA